MLLVYKFKLSSVFLPSKIPFALLCWNIIQKNVFADRMYSWLSIVYIPDGDIYLPDIKSTSTQ